LITAGLLALPGAAHAEDASLHLSQGGALLTYADSEVKLLFTNVSGREFDVDLARALVIELKRTVPDAKKSVDRSSALLSDKQEKVKPDLEALRNSIKTAEDQIGKVESELEKQAAAGKGGDDDGDEDGAKKVGNLDWEPLKNAIGWLYNDLGSARALHDKATKKLGAAALKVPVKPKGKRDE
jgi:hypothetical protein